MKIEHNSQLPLYRSPFGAVTCESTVCIRLAVAEGGLPHSIKLIYTFLREKYYVNMSYVFQVGEYCMYEARIIVPNRTGLLWYYFEIVNNNGKTYYTNNSENLGGIGRVMSEEPKNAYQITVYSKSFKTPDWFKDSVVYQIFPDRFNNGCENNKFLSDRSDIIKRNWGDTPYYKPEQFGGEYLSNDFFGGNLKGIEQKLQYLAELGIGAIYLNPIFTAYSNHKYDTGNYKEIDPSFGNEEDFRRLCEKACEYGINIILDGVFNHTGSNSLYFNKDGQYPGIGAYQSKDSPYYNWYSFTEFPDKYESWWGMKTLPSVNEQCQEYQDYIINNEDSVIKRWLRAGASGWRLDVVDELPGFFVKKLRKVVKETNENAVIIGEVWEDASTKCSYGEQREYFLGEELDSVMNYPLRSAMINFAKNNIDAPEFDRLIMSLKENYPSPAYYSLLNILSTHDVERIITAVSSAPDKSTVDKDFMADFRLSYEAAEKAVKKVKQLVMFQMLMPGVPCIYYGDEIGMQGYADPFCRCCFQWDNINHDLQLWYKLAIALRKSSPVFIYGEFECIYKLNYGYSFIRFNKSDAHIVCANFSDKNEWFRLDTARFGLRELENEIYEEYYSSEDGIYYIEMPPNEVKVFKGHR